MDESARRRAQGCLLGQLVGDSLGGLVEFRSPESIRRDYPSGVRDLADGGTWDTIAGQPTDDSEMALALARSLVAQKTYDEAAVRDAYVRWLDSAPFDCGNTVSSGLRGHPNPESQANGALMRISPLGVFGAFREPSDVEDWARRDAAWTHPHPVCLAANALFVGAVALFVRTGLDPREAYEWALAQLPTGCGALDESVRSAKAHPPRDYVRNQGWVLIAFQNAWWQLLHAPNFEEALVDTVMRGGDTDTNAAIAGALLGAAYGIEAIPTRWTDAIVTCRPVREDRRVRRPRPPEYWPADALELAACLVGAPNSRD